ncbi:hypothetical protein EIB73_10715 [Kaistella carnis]|uniref:Uncharacterized protein n=1 Tax=Kaistella carnis TaxID=1241979 RepID=A0A3G8XPA8_9FLAO|nr:hypothetical protein EIB73_10715 [Kaistella carnis]
MLNTEKTASVLRRLLFYTSGSLLHLFSCLFYFFSFRGSFCFFFCIHFRSFHFFHFYIFCLHLSGLGFCCGIHFYRHLILLNGISYWCLL